MRSMITTAVAAALVAGGWSLALAQTTQTAPSTGGATSGTGGATSGTSVGGMMSPAQVKQKLEKQGYTDIKGLKEEGGKWMAKAKHGGKEVMVDIDKAGNITPK